MLQSLHQLPTCQTELLKCSCAGPPRVVTFDTETTGVSFGNVVVDVCFMDLATGAE